MPGNVTYTNIVVGAAKLFVGPDQFTVDYDIITALKGDDSVYNVGATQDGVSVSWEPDMIDIEVDQFGDAARIITNKQKIVVKTTLAEATLQNLANAWGYSTGVTASKPGLVTPFSATSGTFNIGIASTYPAEKYTRIEGWRTVLAIFRNVRATPRTSGHAARGDECAFIWQSFDGGGGHRCWKMLNKSRMDYIQER